MELFSAAHAFSTALALTGGNVAAILLTTAIIIYRPKPSQDEL